jgi:hypothetical protein
MRRRPDGRLRMGRGGGVNGGREGGGSACNAEEGGRHRAVGREGEDMGEEEEEEEEREKEANSGRREEAGKHMMPEVKKATMAPRLKTKRAGGGGHLTKERDGHYYCKNEPKPKSVVNDEPQEDGVGGSPDGQREGWHDEAHQLPLRGLYPPSLL